ncbi:MAG: thiol:disulfide interchange protein DsbA/DsbL [Pseudomonadota bacterium]|nr:MAG: thiol:disulfide interchange protein DsbA/DsbL [Pseudomonadota bacterium]
MRYYSTAVFAALVLVSTSLAAQPFQEGRHFDRVGTPTVTPEDRVVVTDAFAYPCPACRRFLPVMEAWKADQPDYVEVQRLPVALQPGWDLFARAFYTAEVMGLLDDSHEALFKAVHDERRSMRSFDDIAGFYEQYGVSASSFKNTAQSFAVDASMRQNRNEVRGFGVRGTPTVVVQGKWRVSPSGFNSYDEMMEVVDYLVAREAEALGLGEGANQASEAAEEAGPAADEQSATESG